MRHHPQPSAPVVDERGSASIEFCIASTVIIALCLAVIQFALIGYAREAAGYAAHDALAEAQSYGGDAGDAATLGRQVLGRLTGALSDPKLQVEVHGGTATVTVSGQSRPVLGYARTITVTDTGPVEQWGERA